MTIIREYEQEDIDAVLEVWRRASELAHPFLSDEFQATEAENIRNVHMPKAQTWVYVYESRVVGFIALLGNEVGAIFVEPKHHRRGIGKALMDKAASLHNTLELDVFEANSIGRSFYERYGFTVVDEFVNSQRLLPFRRSYPGPQ